MSAYFKNISEGISTTVTGMRLTLRHLWSARNRRKSGDIRSDNFYDQQDGMVTVQYPLETIPIPDNGRYRLHNEMDDCIVCDKCVKVCPVDCIEIEPIRAIEEVGRASDGSPIRLYAAKFDIDMAKCCYCGLCTTVCPTECLTMTKTFDYSELDVRDMVYNYANITPEVADEKRRLLDQFQKEKEALKTAAKPVSAPEAETTAAPSRPAFKPTIKPKPQVTEAKTDVSEAANVEEIAKPVSKPAFKPVMKPRPAAVEENVEKQVPAEPAAPKPAFRPTSKPKIASDPIIEKQVSDEAGKEPINEAFSEPAPAKPAFRPTMKPKVEVKSEEKPEATLNVEDKEQEEIKPKPAFRPTMKPKAEVKPEEKPEATLNVENKEPEEVKAKPAFRPTMKRKVEVKPEEKPEATLNIENKEQEEIKPKPAFRPTMKPKPPKE